MTGQWTPVNELAPLTRKDLDVVLQQAPMIDQLKVSEQDVSHLKPYVNAAATVWTSLLPALSDDELKQVVYFLVQAEQWSGWESTADASVIQLAKEMRLRGLLPDPNLVSWIRQHSNNRFLPYGPIQL